MEGAEGGQGAAFNTARARDVDPRAEKLPAGAYADGMPIADEQRARAAWVEAHGKKAYHEAVDERTEEENAPKQLPGTMPPTKRE